MEVEVLRQDRRTDGKKETVTFKNFDRAQIRNGQTYPINTHRCYTRISVLNNG